MFAKISLRDYKLFEELKAIFLLMLCLNKTTVTVDILYLVAVI